MKNTLLYIVTCSAILIAQPANATVVITEFMANPLGSDTTGEFVELYNSGASPVDLTGWILSDEDTDTFTLPATTIGAGNFVILAKDRTTFISDWSIPVSLQSSVIAATFSLSNTSADELELENSTPSLIWSLAYPGGNADGVSAYLDPSTTLTVGTMFGSKATPGVDLGSAGDYLNQSVAQEAEASALGRGTASPFAWNGVTQIPEPSTALLTLSAVILMGFRRQRLT